MEEKRNYVIYISGTYDLNEQEHIIKMTNKQAIAIERFMEICDIDGCVELAENYVGEEI